MVDTVNPGELACLTAFRGVSSAFLDGSETAGTLFLVGSICEMVPVAVAVGSGAWSAGGVDDVAVFARHPWRWRWRATWPLKPYSRAIHRRLSPAASRRLISSRAGCWHTGQGMGVRCLLAGPWWGRGGGLVAAGHWGGSVGGRARCGRRRGSVRGPWGGGGGRHPDQVLAADEHLALAVVAEHRGGFCAALRRARLAVCHVRVDPGWRLPRALAEPAAW